MGHKIHPTGFRLVVNRNWLSRWYATGKSYAQMLGEDVKVRAYLAKKLKAGSVGRILIERPAKNARITIFSARPGVVIGKKGEDIETLKSDLQRILGIPVHVNIEEIRKPELDAKLIADSIAQQLEKRIMFRRAMKRAMQNAMRLGAQGIKVMAAGRLNGIEIARTEWYREGRVPLHTLRADIDYGVSEALTTYGIIGVKVWVYKGDILDNAELNPVVAPEVPKEEEKRVRRSPKANEKPGNTGRPSPRGAQQKNARKPDAATSTAEAAVKPAVKHIQKAAAVPASSGVTDASVGGGE